MYSTNQTRLITLQFAKNGFRRIDTFPQVRQLLIFFLMKSIIIIIIPIRKGIVQLLHHSLIERDFNSFDGWKRDGETSSLFTNAIII